MKKLLSILLSALIITSSFTVFSLTSFADSNLCGTFDNEISGYMDRLYSKFSGVPSDWPDDFIAYRTFLNVPDSDMTIFGDEYKVSADIFETMAGKLFGTTNVSEKLKSAIKFNLHSFSYNEADNTYTITVGNGGGFDTSNFFYVVGYSSDSGKYSVYLNRMNGNASSKEALKSYLTENSITFDETKYLVTQDGVHTHKSNVYAKVEVSYSGDLIKFLSVSPVSSAPEGLITWPEKQPEELSSSEDTSSEAPESSSKEETSSEENSSSDNSSSEPENSSSDVSSSEPENNSSENLSSTPVSRPNNTSSNSTPSGSIPSLTPSGLGSILAITDTAIIEAEDGVFPEDVNVNVSELSSGALYDTAKNSLASVASKFLVYDITATSSDELVQPNGVVKATFVIPDGFDGKRLSIVYIADDGEITVLPCTVDTNSSTISAELPHFSLYAIIETIGTTTAEPEGNNILSVIWIIPATLLFILLIATAIWYFLYFKKKTKVYEAPKSEVVNEDEEKNI